MAAEFTTRLPSTVELSGDWEVGLTEITYPRSVCSVVGDEYNFIVEYKQTTERVSLALEYFASITDIIDSIGRKIKQPMPIEFVYDKRSSRMNIKTQLDVGIKFACSRQTSRL